MPQINRKSSLGHWYAPVFAPDFPRDPPEIHGCTLFERCNGCPYPGHGFICLGDGEMTRWNRHEFIGVLDEKYLPDWAREKLMELTAPQQEAPTTGEMKLE